MTVHAEPLLSPSRVAPAPGRAAPALASGGSPAVQRLEALGRSLNARPEAVAQRALGETLSAASRVARLTPRNRTGLPDALKTGAEALSGLSLDDVRVHRNSAKPAQLQAHAFAQGADIHLAPGQERHLPHEAWHVVQQKQGRVRPTMQMQGVAINDDAGLEREADFMGSRAVAQRTRAGAEAGADRRIGRPASPSGEAVFQLGKESTGKRRKGRKEKKKALELDRTVRETRFEEAPEKSTAFHEFGDENRDIRVDPDARGEHGVYLSGNRPDDAPIVDRFRQAYNRLDSWAIYLGEKHPEILEKVNEKFDLDQRHEIAAKVKALTKEYKAKFRDLSDENVYIYQAEFETAVEDHADTLIGLTKTVARWMGQKHPDLQLGTARVHEEGTDLWREKWIKNVAIVNAILETLWVPAKKELNAWILKHVREGHRYPVGDLTYIGSLAKGYKGPPKQHVRFNPSAFDIDANLDSPALADYAMHHDKLLPDRNRIFGRLTTIKPLIKFADRVQQEMVARIEGIEDDPDDLFDVVIVAHDTLEQQEEADRFLRGIGARDTRIDQGH